MNLTDLQKQLRAIEEHAAALQVEIEKMKPQPENRKKEVLEGITKIATQYPLKNRKLPKEMAELSQSYITCLAYIMLAENNKIYEKLLYLSRLARGMGVLVSSEDILRMGMEVDKEYFENACAELKELKYLFLTDTLILANISEEAANITLSLIADIAGIVECDKDDLRAAAYVAKAVLTEDFDVLRQLPIPNKNHWMGQFRQHIPASWINAQRMECGRVCIETTRRGIGIADNSMKTWKTNMIKNKLQLDSIVKRGDALVVYEQGEDPVSSFFKSIRIEPNSRPKEETIQAPCNGIVFYIEDEKYDSSKEETRKELVVYVVSYFDDYKDFCKWYKNK